MQFFFSNLILDDLETKGAEAQTIEEEDAVWVSHAGVQTSDDGIFYVLAPFRQTSNSDMADAQQIAMVAALGIVWTQYHRRKEQLFFELFLGILMAVIRLAK